MAVVIVVLVTAFFLLGFFSIYLRCCAAPPLGGPDEHARRQGVGFVLASSRSARRAGGLDRAVLDSFPTMAYADVKAHKAGKGALECAVCLSEFDDDETLRLLPRCAHAFHADCIDAWLASHVTCPVCRAVLLPDAEAPIPPAPAVSSVPTAEQVDVPVPAALHQPAPETAPPEQAVAVVLVFPSEEETEEERIRREEAAELMRIGSVKRALRSKSGWRPAQFPRSHSTGHSLAAAPSVAAIDSAAERYTLRLPEHVLQEVVAANKLRRSASVQSFWTRRGFSGARSGRSVRLGQSGRWPNMSHLARSLSARLPAWGSTRRGEVGDAPGNDAKVAGDGGGSPPGGCV
jgi:E3 ubiquitin-protein ligase ATL6/9/15/31/42/55